MILTDTHTHLYSEEFSEDREKMIQSAIDSGVSRLFVPSIDSSYTQKMYALEAQYPENVFLMIVGYPTETYEDHLKNLEGLKKYQIYAQTFVQYDQRRTCATQIIRF